MVAPAVIDYILLLLKGCLVSWGISVALNYMVYLGADIDLGSG